MSSTKNIPFIAILTWFLILGKIEDSDHCWWRHLPSAAPPPIKYTSSCWEEKIKGFPLKAKSFRNTATYQKLWVQDPPPPTTPLVLQCGYEFTCSLRVTLLIKSSDGRKNQKRNHLINLPIFYWLHLNDREECFRRLVLSGTVLLKNIMFFTIIALHVQLYLVRVVGCIAL